MTRASILSPTEARADPAHRLWFAFTDALDRAVADPSPANIAAAGTARDAWFDDFVASLVSAQTARRA